MRRPFDIGGMIFYRRTDAELFFRIMRDRGRPGTPIKGEDKFLGPLLTALPERSAAIGHRRVVGYSRAILPRHSMTRCFVAELEDGERIDFGFVDEIRNIAAEQHPPSETARPASPQRSAIQARIWADGKLENELGTILAEHGTLTIRGFENPVSLDDPDFLGRKEELKQAFDHLAVIHDWLNQFEKTKAMNYSVTSYGLKHAAEQALKHYVAPGQLIAAALIAGFRFKHIVSGPNVWLNISRQVLTSVAQKIGFKR